MPQDRPLQPSGKRPPDTGAADSTPSPVARARLSGALRNRAEAYRQDASVDLTIVEALLKLDEHEAAARTIDEHREALQAMARDLQVVVADAAVEREAEAVCEALRADLARRRAVRGLRRRVLTLAGAAAVAVALILPQARLSPRTTLTSMEGGSAQDVSSARERLDAAVTWARALRAQQAAAPARPSAVVRDRARTILAADAPGESAATSSAGAPVVHLDEYRARRERPPVQEDTPPAARPSDEPPLVDLDPRTDTVPHSGVPLHLEAEHDIDQVPPPTTAAPETPLR